MPSRYFQEVFGRAVRDIEFRAALLADPRSTCEAVGLPLDPAEYEAIASADASQLEEAAAEITGMGGEAG